MRSRHEYGRYRLELLGRVMRDGMTPIQVAQELEAAADKFIEIELEECRRYRQMGETWQPYA